MGGRGTDSHNALLEFATPQGCAAECLFLALGAESWR